MFGPLSNHMEYLVHIVLNNFIDYFDFVETMSTPISPKDSYKQTRLFLNAIESANNLPEYFFHDEKAKNNWSDIDLAQVLGKMRKKHKILKDIEQISNAYKHCVRKDNKNLQAADLEYGSFNIKIENNKRSIQYIYESIACDEIMDEAFNFWREYHNAKDLTILVP